MMQPGDTATFTILTGPPEDRREERITGFVQRVHQYDNGALSVVYRYASNPRGISSSCYVEPEYATAAVIHERDPEANTNPRSMLPGAL